ncbi:NTE family protein [Promicromonospora sp. AC04]|uniref:patatin-like phospholipase family protein n=1 Tax=Promicromonospora sp. AC04 TaxID=2135723 RepID=UPI000D38ED7C|nr:patatin-like phospholipase family protein [Promicromonospora sp. AC04]PUB21593.1 NTE family protein [Promicromonospora sp. AC04]
MTVALVLGGGGVAGVAWELGVLQGIADKDAELAARILGADRVIGTSAGSSVAAQITSGTPLEELYAAQLVPETVVIEVRLDAVAMIAGWTAAMRPYADGTAPEPAEFRRRIGAMALAAPTTDEAARLKVHEARLPSTEWPSTDLVIPAVDAESGELTIFRRASGVRLLDAVAASCAVPGLWPPVTIGDRRYIDGGMRSVANVDLAAGADFVLVITPQREGTTSPFGPSAADQIADLAPARVLMIGADDASIEAFGGNPLSPATRAPSAAAGRAVGRAQAAALAALWS